MITLPLWLIFVTVVLPLWCMTGAALSLAHTHRLQLEAQRAETEANAIERGRASAFRLQMAEAERKRQEMLEDAYASGAAATQHQLRTQDAIAKTIGAVPPSPELKIAEVRPLHGGPCSEG